MIFKKIKHTDIKDVSSILSSAFKPYKKYYTNEAYNATILSPRSIKQRIENKESEFFVVIYKNEIVGTIILLLSRNLMYLSSMAVKPKYQKQGVGHFILEEVIKIALSKNMKKLLLESYELLNCAISLYNHFRFKRTGNKRNYYGIEIFEMCKYIKDDL